MATSERIATTVAPPGLATLLVLADGRLPAGGHAHSGGLEAAVSAGRVHDLSTVEAFLRGRLASAGLVAAAFAAATTYRIKGTAGGLAVVGELDVGLDARTPSPALRRASRTQGRALLRAGRAMWTLPPMWTPLGTTTRFPDGPHQSIALGVVSAAAGLTPEHAALVAAYGSISGSASAAVRMLALDPYPVHGLLARLAPACDETARRAANLAHLGEPDLPAASAPLLDISAEDHSAWEVRLFAS
jgi:urease accessory protein